MLKTSQTNTYLLPYYKISHTFMLRQSSGNLYAMLFKVFLEVFQLVAFINTTGLLF